MSLGGIAIALAPWSMRRCDDRERAQAHRSVATCSSREQLDGAEHMAVIAEAAPEVGPFAIFYAADYHAVVHPRYLRWNARRPFVFSARLYQNLLDGRCRGLSVT